MPVIMRGLPERYELALSELYDPTGEAYVVIKPASVAEHAARDELWAKQRRTYQGNLPNAVTVESESTFSQRIALEVFLTMIDCNIEFQDVDDEGNPKGEPKPLFKFGKKGGTPFLNMTREQFVTAWGLLPQEVAEEIHSKVLEKNPQWDFLRETP